VRVEGEAMSCPYCGSTRHSRDEESILCEGCGAEFPRPRLLDLFCGAGGAAKGYHDAGFEVVGVDINPQPHYPYEFHMDDALEVLTRHGHSLDFDAIHASPPCQAHSSIAKQIRKLGKTQREHPDLVPQTRELLQATGLPYVIENVVGAPLVNPIMLCGSSFGLNVRRHRLFETNWPLMALPCAHHWQTPRFQSLDKRRGLMSVVPVYGGGQVKGLASVVGVHGHHNYAGERELREWAMDVDWMSPYELTQAIPPAYTAYIGEALLAHLSAEAAA
jgi:DNA (cytosine-5)-methyltransferase 1